MMLMLPRTWRRTGPVSPRLTLLTPCVSLLSCRTKVNMMTAVTTVVVFIMVVATHRRLFLLARHNSVIFRKGSFSATKMS